MNIETWKSIPGFEYYEASSYGRVRSVDRFMEYERFGRISKHFRPGKILSIRWNPKNGYGNFFPGRGNTIYIHRAIVETFIGKIPKGMAVNHKDGNKKNNFIENLEIVTYAENIGHSYRELGRKTSKGDVLSNEDVDLIKFWHFPTSKNGRYCMHAKILAKIFNRNVSSIKNIASGKSARFAP